MRKYYCRINSDKSRNVTHVTKGQFPLLIKALRNQQERPTTQYRKKQKTLHKSGNTYNLSIVVH